MKRSHHLSTPQIWVAGLFAWVVVALYFVQLRETRLSAGRMVGIYTTKTSRGLTIDEVTPGHPAEVFGLRPGDLLVEIDAFPVSSHEDYDAAASRFVAGHPVVYKVRRGDRTIEVRLTPGVPVQWRPPVVNGLVMLCCLSLGLITVLRRPRSPRARLLWILLFLMALEMALPFNTVGNVALSVGVWLVFYLVTGAQISIELHLASSIPARPPWLARRPWIVPLYYAVGLGLGTVTCLTALAEAATGEQVLPWTEAQAWSVMTDVGLPLWAGAVFVLLGLQASRHPERQGRLQAGFVLLGVLPWVLYVYTSTVLQLAGVAIPAWIDETVFPLVVLAYPVAVLVAIYRYHLLNIELVVRHGLLYTALTTTLLLIFYGALGAGGALFSRLVGSERHSIWVISASTLILGVLFSPLRRWLQGRIDEALFPEREALRGRLIRLASELPRQGTTQRMGHHLVERLCEIFAVRSAALLLVEPDSDLLLTVARKPRDPAKRTTLSVLLSPRDPGLQLLQQVGSPLSVERLAEASPALRQRLDLLAAKLVVPLLFEDRLVGVLTLGAPKVEAVFLSEQVELLNLLAHHVAISLENVRLFESATYEGLTGLLRREAILELLEKELERAQRYGRPLTIAFADLDHFKNVNDLHGHLAGDALLKRVAEELEDGIRSTDAIGRYGGEEFLLIFPETRLDGAAVVAEKIRAGVEELVVPLGGGVTVDVRISMGLASLEEFEGPRPCQARDLIALADKALYRAKQSGRNRVEPAVA